MNQSSDGGEEPPDVAPKLLTKSKAYQGASITEAQQLPPSGGQLSSAPFGADASYSQVAGSGVHLVPSTSWASDASIDSDEGDLVCKKSWWFLATPQESSSIFIPEDLSVVFPAGYAAMVKAAKLHNFSISSNGPSLLGSGLRHRDCYSENIQEAKTKFQGLGKVEQASVVTLMTLMLLAEYKPTGAVTFESRTCVPSSYVLSILLKEVNRDVSIAKAMKHEDGGRSTVIERLSLCFATDRSIVGLLMSALDKIYRSNAKLAVGQKDQKLIDLAEKHCLTSEEGILQNHFKVVKRVEKVEVGAGRTKTTSNVTKIGRIVPNLQIGSDLLKESERNHLKRIATSFNLNDMYTARLSKAHGSCIATKVAIASKLVKEAYQVVEPINSIIRRRKEMIRSQLPATEKGKPVTASMWSQTCLSVVAQAEELAKDVYTSLEDFCKSEDQ